MKRTSLIGIVMLLQALCLQVGVVSAQAPAGASQKRHNVRIKKGGVRILLHGACTWRTSCAGLEVHIYDNKNQLLNSTGVKCNYTVTRDEFGNVVGSEEGSCYLGVPINVPADADYTIIVRNRLSETASYDLFLWYLSPEATGEVKIYDEHGSLGPGVSTPDRVNPTGVGEVEGTGRIPGAEAGGTNTRKDSALASNPAHVERQSRSADDYVRSGVRFLNGGDTKAAMADFDVALRLDPRNGDAHAGRGILLLFRRDFDGAAAEQTRAIELAPRNAVAFAYRSTALYWKGDLDGAIADGSAAIRLSPDFPLGYIARASAVYLKGDYAAALDDFAKAAAITPPDAGHYIITMGGVRMSKVMAVALTGQGSVRKKLKDYSGATAAFIKALQSDPTYPESLTRLARLMSTCPKAEFRDGRRAVEYATKAGEVTGWQEPVILETIGVAYAETGNYVEAIRWQQKALEHTQYEKEEGVKAREKLELYRQKKPYREP